ncbi:MAG TPA: hypothetical protein VF706_05965 [Solirubrobacteraceae bacterium]
MTLFRRLICVCVLALALATTIAVSASATTFYVNKRSGSDANPCTSPGGPKPSEQPCATIKGAVKRAEAVAGPNTIELSAEENPYVESVELLSNKDAGLRIDGEEPGVVVVGKEAPGAIVHLAGSVTFSNLRIDASTKPALLKSAIALRTAALELDNVEVENESSEGIDGIEAKEAVSVTMNGGRVLMENGASGFAIEGREAPLVLNGVTVINGGASGSEAGGVNSEKSTLEMTNTNVAVEAGLGPVLFGVAAGRDTSVSLSHVAVKQNTSGIGVVLEKTPATVDGLRVEMLNAESSAPGLLIESETAGISSTVAGLEVSGAWKGAGLLADGEQLTLTDSRVTQGASSELPALKYAGGGSGAGLVVQRSVLQARPAAKPAALAIDGSNATTDSSEILGGKDGVFDENAEAVTRTLTLSASTIDAGAPGTAGDAAGVNGVEAIAKNGPGSVLDVSIQGSISLEKHVASASNGDQANVACTYSAAPSQSQAAGGGAGAISCTAGTAGNGEVEPLSSLFSEPLTAYELNPSSSAVDGVPASAISLPFGLTPSATDLAGNARATDGNGDCVAVQDKGALELQGHSAACPTPISTPTPGGPTRLVPPLLPRPAITALTVSPSAFFAAPFGATISKASKKRYGAKISWRDSVAATTTFTIMRPSAGRRQGKSCKKPSKRNKHGKRCMLLNKVGTFTHVDVAGANSIHFSGRVKGKLTPGNYVLQGLPRNGAGAGAVVSRPFKIK